MELKVEKMQDKELEKIAEIGKDADESKIEASLNYENLTDEEKAAIDKFNQEIDVHDQTQVLQFGNAAQEKISKFSDSVLENVRTKDAGETGKLLGDLVAEIKSFDHAVDSSQKMNIIERIFNAVSKYR